MIASGDSGVAAGQVSQQGWDEKGIRSPGEGEFSTRGTKLCLLVTTFWHCSCTLAGVVSSVLLTCVRGGHSVQLTSLLTAQG